MYIFTGSLLWFIGFFAASLLIHSHPPYAIHSSTFIVDTHNTHTAHTCYWIYCGVLRAPATIGLFSDEALCAIAWLFVCACTLDDSNEKDMTFSYTAHVHVNGMCVASRLDVFLVFRRMMKKNCVRKHFFFYLKPNIGKKKTPYKRAMLTDRG